MLKERMDILQQACIISDDVSNYVKRVIDMLQTSFADKQSGMEMFTTHLAMAAQRILHGEESEQLDDVIWSDVQTSPYFSQALATYELVCEHAPCEFPEGEKRFLIMHLCNLHQ